MCSGSAQIARAWAWMIECAMNSGPLSEQMAQRKSTMVHGTILVDCLSGHCSGHWPNSSSCGVHHAVAAWHLATVAFIVSISWLLSTAEPIAGATHPCDGHWEKQEERIACRHCINHQTWSTLGLHLVYTWYTPNLHIGSIVQP